MNNIQKAIQTLAKEYKTDLIRKVDENLQGEPIIFLKNSSKTIIEIVIDASGRFFQTAVFPITSELLDEMKKGKKLI